MTTDYAELFETIDSALQAQDTSFEDLVIEAINAYGEFYSAMTAVNSMKEVDIVASENPDGVQVNTNVQYLLELEQRGIVQLLGDVERIERLRHPILSHVSKADVQSMIEHNRQSVNVHDIIETMVFAQAAKAVLGGVEYNVDIEWLATHNINIIHPAHGTVQ